MLKQRYLNHYTKQKYGDKDYVVEIVDVFDGIKPITGINNVMDSATAHASHGFTSLSTKSDDNPSITETLHENVVKQLKNIDTEDIIKKAVNLFEAAEKNTLDGIKFIWKDKWVHLRKSNTEPIIRIYAEAPDKNQALELIDKIKSLI